MIPLGHKARNYFRPVGPKTLQKIGTVQYKKPVLICQLSRPRLSLLAKPGRSAKEWRPTTSEIHLQHSKLSALLEHVDVYQLQSPENTRSTRHLLTPIIVNDHAILFGQSICDVHALPSLPSAVIAAAVDFPVTQAHTYYRNAHTGSAHCIALRSTPESTLSQRAPMRIMYDHVCFCRAGVFPGVPERWVRGFH